MFHIKSTSIRKKAGFTLAALTISGACIGLTQVGLASAAPQSPAALAPQAWQSERCPDSIHQPPGTADLHLPVTVTDDARKPQGSVYGFTDIYVVNPDGDICAQTLKVGAYSTRETTTGVALAPCTDASCASGSRRDAVWNSGNRLDQSPPVMLATYGRCFVAAGEIFSGPDGHGNHAVVASGPICWSGDHLRWEPTR